MTFPVIPLVEKLGEQKFGVTGKILIPNTAFRPEKHVLTQCNGLSVSVLCSEELSVDDMVAYLNVGVKQLFVSISQFQQCVSAGLPSGRFAVFIDDGDSAVVASIFQSNASVVVSKPVADFKSASASGNKSVFYLNDAMSQQQAEQLAQQGYVVVVKEAKCLLEAEPAADKIGLGKVFVATLTTDRNDGLFTTLITSSGPAHTALGVVYSSKQSILAAVAEGKGVYQSRKRPDELWYKGATSGATQRLVKLEKDCDSDLVKFVVEPRSGFGFCHLEKNFTCFQDGDLAEDSQAAAGSGLAKLDATLAQRKANAPEGLYTRRLFNDDSLLEAKMREELDELVDAGKSGDRNEVAWEAADLFYFALTWAAKHGVSLSDIERNLDVKSMKVTRRKGDAKPGYMKETNGAAEPAAKKAKTEATEATEAKPEPTFTMEAINVSTAPAEDVERALTRPNQKTSDIMKLVLPIVEQVQRGGDKALVELTAKFDGVQLTEPVLRAPFPEDAMAISEEMREAIDLSMANIEKFHRAQLPREEIMTVETAPGVLCSRFAKPIENVGLYVPGGTAVLPSTAMMLGVPAKVAGCKNIVVATPPLRATGRLTPEVVYVAHKLGARSIVMAGGAQAVTAMAYGTESVVKCDKILGPGNQFVTAAKMHVQNDTTALCSIDMPAGPSEVLVVADGTADPDFVASDLLSQAEHGVDSQVILIGVGLSQDQLRAIEAAVRAQADVLPRRDIVAKCLAHSYTLLVENYEKAFELSNRYAPEHLILQIENAASFVPSHVEHAGSVFVGGLSPESCGDYSSGTNHTLPTYGYARQYSGVNTATFQKFITSQEVSREGLQSIGKAVMTLAAVEGLEAHRNAVQVRMDKLGL